MRNHINGIYHKVLVFLRLSPLSLAEKCRLAFGAAIVFILSIALLLPYIWMGQLTKKASLDAGRAKSDMLFRCHFQINKLGNSTIVSLDNTGAAMDANSQQLIWLRFTEKDEKISPNLTEKQKNIIELLKNNEDRNDYLCFVKHDGALYSNYVRIFRATDSCISCHNSQGMATAFGQNEPIGAAVVRTTAARISKIAFINKIWIIVAGLIGGAGAIVAFYIITQRVILRPIRQLRALANNVAEGNLDTRSSIKTRDEYEKLADAFNHMLDELQAGQEKLRNANKQLDAKIAELSERNIELFKANKIKGEFLANISHEFRTPLNAILGFAEILREKPGVLNKEKNKRYAENIITSGKRLLNMINDLLDLAKTEAGKMDLHIEKFSLHDLCDALVGSFSSLTKKERIKVRLRINKDIPQLVTDAGKIQQILYNFLSNAVKFTPQKGKIEIKADLTDDKHIRLSVSDTGCGIADEDKEKIFEKFQQADGSITRKSTGSGLGLAISKELAAMLAGSIGLESKPDEGSTFWLEIPITLTPNIDGNKQANLNG